jgi:uncharacterized protein (TIGR02270 family)
MLGAPVAVDPIPVDFTAPDAPAPAAAQPGLEPWLAACANQREPEFLEAMAGESLEEIAALRNRRAPTPLSTFRDPFPWEERLLAQLDALLACGEGALQAGVARVADSEIEDPDALFAVLLALGCVARSSALEDGLRLVRLAGERDRAGIEAAVEAFQVMPHPMTASAVRPLLGDPAPALREFALRVLSHRNALAAPEAAARLDDADPSVVASATAAFATLPRRDLPGSLTSLLEHPHPAVVRAALWTLLRHGDVRFRSKATELCRGTSPLKVDALWTLALFGGRSDSPTVREAVHDPPSPDALLAAAAFGDLALVERFLDLLEDTREELRAAASSALARLTGGTLQEERVVPADASAPAGPGGRAFYAEPLPPQRVSEPSVDRRAWTRWWSDLRPRINQGMRTRWGRPWSPAEVLAEMEHGPGERRHRERLHIELALCAGDQAPPYRALDFVARQETAIAAWRAWVAAAGTSTGSGSWRA